jgi:hypothetical protein
MARESPMSSYKALRSLSRTLFEDYRMLLRELRRVDYVERQNLTLDLYCGSAGESTLPNRCRDRPGGCSGYANLGMAEGNAPLAFSVRAKWLVAAGGQITISMLRHVRRP